MGAIRIGLAVLAGVCMVVVTCPAQAPAPAGGDGAGLGATGDSRGEGLWAGRMARGSIEEALLDRLTSDPALAGELGLKDDQVQALKKLRFDTEGQLISLRADMQQAGLKQVQLMTADTPDEAAVLKAVEDTGAIRTKIAKLQVQQVLAAKKILTPDQIKQAKALLHERIKQRMQDGGGGLRQGLRGRMMGAQQRGAMGSASNPPPAGAVHP